jgi:hypothetical protein
LLLFLLENSPAAVNPCPVLQLHFHLGRSPFPVVHVTIATTRTCLVRILSCRICPSAPPTDALP